MGVSPFDALKEVRKISVVWRRILIASMIAIIADGSGLCCSFALPFII